ncbi:hypothetical protein AB1Y20_015662 [Prymnesium parvum]|uniref:Uncharacterized protein n=1 Tax=Prymnesium parvum TaxID=97485 RepID=A0AB34K1G8_PRYPA
MQKHGKQLVLSSLLGVSSGFVAGFLTAEALYATESAKAEMKRKVKIVSMIILGTAATIFASVKVFKS